MVLAGIFSLLVAVAGWYYLMHAPTSGVLGGIENEKINRRRLLLRRVGGGVMVTLAACFYALVHQLLEAEYPSAKLLYMIVAVALLLVVILVLALVDLRLTWRLRRQQRP